MGSIIRGNVILINVVCAVAGVVYIKSSGGKISNPYGFSKAIEGYNLFFTSQFARLLAIIIGPIELTVGIMILFNVLREEAIWVGLCLQAFFIIFMMARMNQVLPFGCGCFGLHGPEKVTMIKLASNIGYMLTLVAILLGIHSFL